MLTYKEKQTYDFIKNYIETHHIAPTLPEIAAGIGFQSKGTTSKYVNMLVNRGYLAKHKSKGQSRNIFLTERDPNLNLCRVKQAIPLVGTIAAGAPIEAISNSEACDINDIIQGDNLFMLRVKGRSMIEEGIDDGDYIICEQTDTANDGDIVVALVHGEEATLKRIYRKAGKVILCPANYDMAPMEFDEKAVVIQGKLKHKLRNY